MFRFTRSSRPFKAIGLTLAFILSFLGQIQGAQASVPPKLIAYVAVLLTPNDDPTYWLTQDRKGSAEIEINAAISAWNQMAQGKIKFSSRTIVTKPIPSLAHCDYKRDWAAGFNEYRAQKKVVGNYFIYINPRDECGNSGYALVGGHELSIRDIEATTIAHEIGHNLGFKHSATVSCLNDDLAVLNENCSAEQYGDKTDVMGAGIVFETPKLSAAQSYLVLSQPTPKSATTGLFTLSSSGSKAGNKLVKVQTKAGMALLEFDDATQNGGYKIAPDESPGVQLRLVGYPFAQRFSNSNESGIGTLLVGRLHGYDEFNVCNDYCYLDSRFHSGEKFQIPNSKYFVTVVSTSPDSARIQISGKR